MDEPFRRLPSSRLGLATCPIAPRVSGVCFTNPRYPRRFVIYIAGPIREKARNQWYAIFLRTSDAPHDAFSVSGAYFVVRRLRTNLPFYDRAIHSCPPAGGVATRLVLVGRGNYPDRSIASGAGGVGRNTRSEFPAKCNGEA